MLLDNYILIYKKKKTHQRTNNFVSKTGVLSTNSSLAVIIWKVKNPNNARSKKGVIISTIGNCLDNVHKWFIPGALL